MSVRLIRVEYDIVFIDIDNASTMLKLFLTLITLLALTTIGFASHVLTHEDGYTTYYTRALVLQTKLTPGNVVYLTTSATEADTNLPIIQDLGRDLRRFGYNISTESQHANYWLQIHIAAITRLDPAALAALADSQYGFSVATGKTDTQLPLVLIADLQLDEQPLQQTRATSTNPLIRHYSRVYIVSPANTTPDPTQSSHS